MSNIKKSAFSVFRDKGKPTSQEISSTYSSTDDDHPKAAAVKKLLDGGITVSCFYFTN
jgi:hypothetical protein